MDVLLSFDYWLLGLINGLAQKSPLLDTIVGSIAGLELIKGAVVVSLLLYVWLAPSGRLASPNMAFGRSALGAAIGIVAGRAMQVMLPYRHRPTHDPTIEFNLPIGQNPDTLQNWSSFPSDHAVLYFAIATAVWITNRRLGLFAFLWTVLVIGFARVYTGFHFPTDILGGGLLGMFVMWFAFKVPIPVVANNFMRRWEEAHAPSLYALAFIIAFQMATVFNDGRYMARLGWEALRGAQDGLI